MSQGLFLRILAESEGSFLQFWTCEPRECDVSRIKARRFFGQTRHVDHGDALFIYIKSARVVPRRGAV